MVVSTLPINSLCQRIADSARQVGRAIQLKGSLTLGWIILCVIVAAVLGNILKQAKSATQANLPLNRPGHSSGAAPKVDDYQDRLNTWRASWAHEVDRARWIPSGAASRLIAKYPPPRPAVGSGRFGGPAFELDRLVAEFKAHNRSYLETQRVSLRSFFSEVEKSPLTDEQIAACVCMDDSVMIVAAAGSGKTSTMVAKAGYALHQGLVQPEQVLLLAFNKDAATELLRRVRDRLSSFPGVERVTAKTFSAFGLDVIGQATGKKPSLAPWLNTAGQEIEAVVDIVRSLSRQDPQFKRDWDFYRVIYGRDPGKWNETTPPETFDGAKRGFRTADGTVVKSKEERVIANWLFFCGVTYAYERPYEHGTATEKFGQYRPDFYYPDIDLYHEHFALDHEGKAPAHFDGDYEAGVLWKRELHAEKGSALIETTSASLQDGVALDHLEKALVDRGLELNFDPTRVHKGPPPISDKELARTLRVFQQHVKSNGLSDAQLDLALLNQSKGGHPARLKMFLSIYRRISSEWERRLGEAECIDFEDMLLLAAGHIESGRFKSPYTFILADEFQDSSRARIRLLKALTVAPGRAHLSVVGDDWQGINRFAGADVSVMSEFDKTFVHATTLTLNTTFRCPQTICDVSGEFVQVNPSQIRKTVQATNPFANRPLQAYGFKDLGETDAHIEGQLSQMRELLINDKLKPTSGDRATVLLLGRYRNDQPKRLRQWQGMYGDRLDIAYRTIHASKGLEAEYVYLLNVVEGARGFPSQIEDDPVLQLAMPAPDAFPMAEERRLFYVALTRASRQVRIYTSLTKPSRFVVELVAREAITVEPVDGDPLAACPKCRAGVLTMRTSGFAPFLGCSRYPTCDYKQPLRKGGESDEGEVHRLSTKVEPESSCPTCGRGSMQVKENKRGKFLGCSEFPACKTIAPLS